MENEIIKERLKEEIKASKMPINKIALQVGVTPEMITQYSTTNKMPRLETFAKLCKVLGCSADYILGIDDYKF